MRRTSGHYKGLVTAPVSMYSKVRGAHPGRLSSVHDNDGSTESLPVHIRVWSDEGETVVANALTDTRPLFVHPPLPGAHVEFIAGESSLVVCVGTDPPSTDTGLVVRLLSAMRHGGETPEQATRVEAALRASGCDVLYMGASVRTMDHGGADASVVEMDWQRRVYARQGGVSAWVYPVVGCWIARGAVAARWAQREREGGVTLAALTADDTDGVRVGVDWECRVFQYMRPLVSDATVVCYGREREGRVALLEAAFRVGGTRAHVWFGSDAHFFPVHDVPWVRLNHTQGAVGVVPSSLGGWHAALHALDGDCSRACLLVRDGAGGSESVTTALRALRDEGVHLWTSPSDWVLVRGGERRMVRPGAPLVGMSRAMIEACQRCERALHVGCYELVASFLLNEVLDTPVIADAASTGLSMATVEHQRAYDRLVTRRRECAKMWG